MRHRTVFPGEVNFSGWWVVGQKHKITGQLDKCGIDLWMHVLYNICFTDGQRGNGEWTTEELIESGAKISREKPIIT